MRLTSERLEVNEGERIHAVAIVSSSKVATAARGGLTHLRHELNDVGFLDVVLHDRVPSDWVRGHDVPKPNELEWLLWIEMTAGQTASLRRDLTEDVRIVDAWDAWEDDDEPVSSHRMFLTLYAIEEAPPERIEGAVHVFGWAYALPDVAGVLS